MSDAKFSVGEIATVDFSGIPDKTCIENVEILEVDDDPRKETMYKVLRLQASGMYWLYENVLNKKELADKPMKNIIDKTCKDFTEYVQIADAVKLKYENGTVIDGIVNGVSPTLMSVNTKAFRRMIYLSDLTHCGFVIEVMPEDTSETDLNELQAIKPESNTTVYPDADKAAVGASSDLVETSTGINEGRKYDTGKPMYNLLPADALEEVVKVLTYGSNKYNEPAHEENWRKVQHPEQRYFAACQRHLWAIRRGEPTDQESGILHYAHAITSLMFLLQLELEKTKTEV